MIELVFIVWFEKRVTNTAKNFIGRYIRMLAIKLIPRG